jgi:hypothetical protein
VKDQHLYKDLPIIGAKKPLLKITLNKAVQLMNARGTVLGVQKKGQNIERQKKRKADEIEAAGSSDVRSGTAIASGSGAPTVRSTRAAVARGEASLARGRGGARGAHRRGRTS